MVIGSTDAHFNAILKEVWHIKLIKNVRCLRRDSNQGPLAPADAQKLDVYAQMSMKASGFGSR